MIRTPEPGHQLHKYLLRSEGFLENLLQHSYVEDSFSSL